MKKYLCHNLVLDFDRTVFDTDKFMIDMLKVCEEYGISKFAHDKIRLRQLKLDPRYSLHKILQEHFSVFPKKFDLVNIALNDYAFNHASRYIFSDVVPTIELAKKNNWRIVLFTYGDLLFQKFKIEASGIHDRFDEIIITGEKKCFASHFLKWTDGICCDDNPGYITEMHAANKNLIYVEVKREGAKYSGMNSPFSNHVVGSLSDISNLLR